MTKGEKRVLRNKKLVISLLVILAVVIPLFFIFPKIIGYITQEQTKKVQFYFYDEQSNCSLDGYVFSADNLIGKSRNGIFNLTYENYLNNFNNTQNNISVFGKLGSCFSENSDLFFDKYWKSFEIPEYYFSGGSLFKFNTDINPNNPSKRELIGFIQPGKLSLELDSIALSNIAVEDLSAINNYLNSRIKYAKDWDFNKETNYWQTPQETLQLNQGDCEDYSSALLSLFLAYNFSLDCYNLVFSSHVTTFCRIGDYYAYYDQEKTELKKYINPQKTSEEIKSELRNLKQDYLDYYGINSTNKTETKVYYAFNNNQYVEFKNDEEFIDWQYSLEPVKPDYNFLSELENQVNSLEGEYEASYEELASENPSANSAELTSEKPALKGFFAENSILLVSAGVIVIVLVFVLLKLNKK